MIIRKFFRFLNDTLDSGGTDTTPPVDRGDDLIPPTVEKIDPSIGIKADPAVAALEKEIEGKEDPADDTKEGEDKVKDTRIPAARHKEILEKERAKTAALAAENAQLKTRGELGAAGADASAEFATIEASVQAMEEQYADLLTDGKNKEAVAVMAKIRQAERHMAELKSDLKVRAASLQMAESARYETALTRIESAFPQLNPDHENYDEKTMSRVARMARANQADGMTQVAALQDAVEAVIGAETTQQEKATTVTPRTPAADRKAEAVGKTVKAVAKTPPSLTRVGQDSDKLGGGELDPRAVAKMSQKEFAGLSEATLAKMRGDVVA